MSTFSPSSVGLRLITWPSGFEKFSVLASDSSGSYMLVLFSHEFTHICLFRSFQMKLWFSSYNLKLPFLGQKIRFSSCPSLYVSQASNHCLAPVCLLSPSLHLQSFALIYNIAAQIYRLIVSVLHRTVGLNISSMVFIITKTSPFNLICAHKGLFCSLGDLTYLCNRGLCDSLGRTKWGMKVDGNRMGM